MKLGREQIEEMRSELEEIAREEYGKFSSNIVVISQRQHDYYEELEIENLTLQDEIAHLENQLNGQESEENSEPTDHSEHEAIWDTVRDISKNTKYCNIWYRPPTGVTGERAKHVFKMESKKGDEKFVGKDFKEVAREVIYYAMENSHPTKSVTFEQEMRY